MAPKTAVMTLEQRLKSNPRSLAYARLAEHFRTSGQIDRAVEICAKGVALHPDHCSGHVVLGRCFMDQGNWEGAADELTTACRMEPRNFAAIKLLGDVFRQRGIKAKAGDLYRLLLKMDPFNTSLVALSSTIAGAGKSDLFEIIADVNSRADDRVLLTGNDALYDNAIPEEVEPIGIEPSGDTLQRDAGMTPVGIGAPGDIELSGTTGLIADTGLPAEVAPAGDEVPAIEMSPVSEEIDSDSESEEEEPEEFAAAIGREIGMNEAGLGHEPAVDSITVSAPEVEPPPIPEALLEKTSDSELPDGFAISSRLESLFSKEVAPGPDLSGLADLPASGQEEELELLGEAPDEIGTDIEGSGTLSISEPSDPETPEDLPKIEPEAIDSSLMPEMVEPSFPEEPIADEPPRDDLIVPDELASLPSEPEEVIFETAASAPVIEAGPAATPSQAIEAGEEEFLPGYIITPTLAEIYFMQGQLQRGLDIYRRLLRKEPGNTLYKQRIGEIEAAITAGNEALPLSNPERGKASRKASAGSLDSQEPE